jgi:TatD DNase family protein
VSARERTWPPAPEPLPVPVVDNHTHLDFDALALGPDVGPLDAAEAMKRARAVNVTRAVQVGCDLESARWTVRVAGEVEGLYGAGALHPNETPKLAASRQLDAALGEIEELARDPLVVAVGESGLDHYRTDEVDWPVQEYALRAHIEIAKRVGKPLQIHDRDAHADVLRVLEDTGAPDAVVFHCFSGDESMARYAVRRGYFLSFAGTVTFRNAPQLRAALVTVPGTQLLVETDAPFLTPEPFRGRPNSPYLVPLTVRGMAQIRGEPLVTCAEATTRTAERVYGLPPA